MPLSLYFFPSFKRSLKPLGHQERIIVGSILEALTIYYSSNCNLLEAQKISPRFFFKQLRRPYYESGIEGKLRVIIKKEGTKCIAVLAGNHNQVKKFLKNI